MREEKPDLYTDEQWNQVATVLKSTFMPNFTRPEASGPVLFKHLPWLSSTALDFFDYFMARRVNWPGSPELKLADADTHATEFTFNLKPPRLGADLQWAIDEQADEPEEGDENDDMDAE